MTSDPTVSVRETQDDREITFWFDFSPRTRGRERRSVVEGVSRTVLTVRRTGSRCPLGALLLTAGKKGVSDAQKVKGGGRSCGPQAPDGRRKSLFGGTFTSFFGGVTPSEYTSPVLPVRPL